MTGESILLRGGKHTKDPRLDWVYPGVDAHLPSLRFLARDLLTEEMEKPPRSYTWRIPMGVVLDQGAEGSCVGHGMAHELLARPQAVPDIDHRFAVENIYWPAQKRDYWEGGAYPGATPFMEGTSVLAGAQIVTEELGYYTEYRWALDLKDMAYSVGYAGPVVIGVDWKTGMFNTNSDGFITATGSVEGGHCVCVIGCKIVYKNPTGPKTWANVDLSKSYFTIINSWGIEWGVYGIAKISFYDLQSLIPGGEFMVAKRRRQ